MTEFDTIKAMLERIGDTLEITTWEKLDGEALIEDKTAHVEFWFKDWKLDYVFRINEDY